MSTEIKNVAVIGGGYMGGGIAQTFALAGLPCLVADTDEETAGKAVDRLLEEGRKYEKIGLFPEGAYGLLTRNLSPAPTLESAVSKVDFVVEAVPEILNLKLSIIKRISAAISPDTIIGTNTSAIPIGTLSNSASDPSRFLGVHWMNPSYFVPSVEVIRTMQTKEETLQAVEALLRRAGKISTRVSDSAGFVANRLQFALYKEAVKMVEEDLATPAEIDEVVSNSFGFRLAIFGPFAIADIAGLDVYEGSFRSMEKAYGSRMAAPELLKQKVARGELGLKSGKGFLPLDSVDATRLANFRDNAYFELDALKKRLGPAPLN